MQRPSALKRFVTRLAMPLCLVWATQSMADPDLDVVSETKNVEDRLGPKSDLAVYWVGHSLVEQKARTEWGEISLMTLVGRFAESRGLAYRMGDHTLWGSPLSALWRGRPHGYSRDAAAMVVKREEFQANAGRYDTLVATDALPIQGAARSEYSAYYLRRFYCALKAANPSARVYLYQTWVNFQGNDPYSKFPPLSEFSWRDEMLAQRPAWEEVADAAAGPEVRAPGWLERLGWGTTSDGGCTIHDPIFIVPAGQALVALHDHLAARQRDDVPSLPGGSPLTMKDLFGNPYLDWPVHWPTREDGTSIDAADVLAGLTLRDPSRPHDDIHLSAVGIYFVSLVHFATLYRQSPVGLPVPASIGDDVAGMLQCLAWKAVVADPRSGVLGTADGCGL